MNSSDLFMYSQMKLYQAELLREARAVHQGRAAVRAARMAATDPATEPSAEHMVEGASWSHEESPGHPVRPVRGAFGTTPLPRRPRSARLRRLAARVGTSLVAVGRRLERIDGR